MSQLPLSARLLLLWLAAVTLTPAALGLAQAIGLAPSGLLPVAILAAVLAAVLGLLIFEPPRSRSLRAWLAQLRSRLVPNPPSNNQEH
jgi:hypothetical protein